MTRILIVEDDPMVANLNSRLIQTMEGFELVGIANDAKEALSFLAATNVDLILLDIYMPGMNGLEMLDKVRELKCPVDVLVVSAARDSHSIQNALRNGAVDYLIKPFDTGELLARVRAMTRRKAEYTPNILEIGNVTLNRENSELSASKDTIRLTNKEFQMLEMLMENPNMLISTERFLERIWGLDTDSEINVVWTYISTLRKKLGNVGANVQIKASRGSGYTLEEFDLDAADQPEEEKDQKDTDK